MSREDLGVYSDGELALRFANVHALYDYKDATWVDTIRVAMAYYQFTDAQLDDLKKWWDDYQEEDE